MTNLEKEHLKKLEKRMDDVELLAGRAVLDTAIAEGLASGKPIEDTPEYRKSFTERFMNRTRQENA